MIRFSVVIPSYNSHKTILRALKSCMSQTIAPLEVIIIDDCSNDGSYEIIREFCQAHDYIKLFRNNENRGVSFSRNLGLEKSNGDYIAFLDSDDFWGKEKLEIHSKAIEEFNYPDCLCDNFSDKFSENPIAIGETKLIYFRDLLIRNRFNGSSIVLKKSVNIKFDENQRYCEDYALLLKLSYYSPIVHINRCLTYLSRPQLSIGGLSENHFKMRLGEMKSFFSLAKLSSWFYIFIPFLIFYSIAKYIKMKLI